LTQLAKKWTESAEGVQGEQGGVIKSNEGRLEMWSDQKMRSMMSMHNDDMKCFKMVVQETNKLVVMGYINFKDHALIKRQWTSNKMNVMGRISKDEKLG
jgi:hypothetical protein